MRTFRSRLTAAVQIESGMRMGSLIIQRLYQILPRARLSSSGHGGKRRSNDSEASRPNLLPSRRIKINELNVRFCGRPPCPHRSQRGEEKSSVPGGVADIRRNLPTHVARRSDSTERRRRAAMSRPGHSISTPSGAHSDHSNVDGSDRRPNPEVILFRLHDI